MEDWGQWFLGIALTIVTITISIATALKKTFLFRSEFESFKENHAEKCRKLREGCMELHKKDMEIQQKDLEMRDAAIERLEQKFDVLFEETKSMRKEMKEDINCLKSLIEAQARGGNRER